MFKSLNHLIHIAPILNQINSF